jgi:cbb3-type cytochrome oxidase subunit 3
MSFLSAAFLIALPLVAVPIVIHLYRGRRRDVVMWGAMHFLAAAVTKGRSMERSRRRAR